MAFASLLFFHIARVIVQEAARDDAGTLQSHVTAIQLKASSTEIVRRAPYLTAKRSWKKPIPSRPPPCIGFTCPRHVFFPCKLSNIMLYARFRAACLTKVVSMKLPFFNGIKWNGTGLVCIISRSILLCYINNAVLRYKTSTFFPIKASSLTGITATIYKQVNFISFLLVMSFRFFTFRFVP